MDADELDAAYMAVQAAYDAYEALTEEQQAEITGADRFETLFGWFNEQVAPLADVQIYPDDVDADGNIVTSTSFQRGGPVLTAKDTYLSGKYYIVQDNVTIDGNLTVDGSQNGGLVLCDGATLTVEGALIHTGGTSFFIYGQTLTKNSNGTGKLVIENSNGDGAAIRSTANNSQLGISSGKLELNDSGSGNLVDKVALYSTSPVHIATLDGKKIPFTDWRYKYSISGKELLIKYCDHDNAIYVPDGAAQHKKNCPDCGFVGKAVNCTFNGNGGYDKGDANGHYAKCDCGNVATTATAHDMKTTWTDDGLWHTSVCVICGYIPEGSDKKQHTYGNDGICTVCRFKPVAKVAKDNADYRYADVNDALEEAAAHDNKNVTLETEAKEGKEKKVDSHVSFDYAGKSIELAMNGYTLQNSHGNATITVEDGTLTVTGEANIIQNGIQELASSAIHVTGGKLIFKDTLNATGASGKYAVEATGGTLDMQGKVTLNGGLKVLGDATLRTKLKADDVLNGGVSVNDSKNYETVNALLGDGLAFAKADNTIVKGNVKSITEDVKVVTHQHTMNGSECTECGYTCSHKKADGSSAFENGVCTICHSACLHTAVTENSGVWTCNTCGGQMVVKIENGSATTYSTDFAEAMNNAANGTTITLLTDINNSGKRACINSNDVTVILNLNGHTISEGWIHVGIDENYGNYSSSTLKIIGSGSFITSGNLSVAAKATLDLSEWGGRENDSITRVELSKSDADESELIVGENAGTIGTLGVYNWPTVKEYINNINNTRLSGGSYNAISITMKSDNGGARAIPYSSMLAEGYAFQYIDKEKFVEYAEKAEYSNGGGTINNVKVVKCPHSDIDLTKDDHNVVTSATCRYCGLTGIVAMLDGKAYTGDTLETAVDDWLTSGGKLTLYSNYSNSSRVKFSSESGKALVLDLNGFAFNKDTVMTLDGADLTIQDSREKDTSYGAFGAITADRGTLTLENGGYLTGLTVPANSNATVNLKNGKVYDLICPKPVYTLMPNGYAMMNGSLTVDPTEISSKENTQTYTIKNTHIKDIDTEKTGSTDFGSKTIPFALSLKTDDSEIGKMSFKWYRIDSTTGAAVELASCTEDETPVDGVYTFDQNNITINSDGWNGMTAGSTYDVICVVAGKASGGAYRWQTSLTGYKLTVDQADLNSDKTQITVTDSDSIVYTGKALTPGVTVTYNGTALTENTDYTVSYSDNTNAGTAKVTIAGTGNYKGSKTVTYTLKPAQLTFNANVVSKQYDGTDTANVDVTFTGLKNDETLAKDTDYTVTAKYNNASAGEGKTVTGTVTLNNTDKAKNYVLNGNPISITGAITKAHAPTVQAGSLTVVNNLARTYTVDLAALLPANLNYGDISYLGDTDSVKSLSDYCVSGPTGGATFKDGILTLPINAVQTSNTGKIGTIKVYVFTTNYEKITLAIDVYATNKIIPTGTPTLSKTAITYGEALSTIELSGMMFDDSTVVEGTFTWADDASKPNAGEYEAMWKFAPKNTEKYQETSGAVKITVNKATPTGAPKYTLITESGKTLGNANLTLVDSTLKPAAGSIIWIDENGNVLFDETKVEANKTYGWRFTPSDENYTELTGTVELYHVSSHGSSSSTLTYPVSTPGKTENGSVTVSPKNSSKGSIVIITVKPDSGYQLDKLTVTDSKGNELKLTDKGDGKYTFTMPAGKVEVNVAFSKEAETSPFRDVDTDAYYYEAIKWAAEKGITGGIGNGLFGPDQHCTRAQIVTLLWRAAGSPEPKTISKFSDVAASSYYAKAVAWAVEKGITNGVGNNKFDPNATCTRAQSVAFLYRATGKQVSSKAQFGDVPSNSYYADAVAWATANDVTNGIGGGLFGSDNSCTRAQIVTFLYRAYQR